MAPGADALVRMVRDGTLFECGDAGTVRCLACAHTCWIPPGASGVCRVRFNRAGRLLVPWGYVSGASADPIEKKPFFHVLPGSLAYSFGMLGCNLHCPFCQNWFTSQALRDPRATTGVHPSSPDALVREATRAGARAVVSTYNEPLITIEWAAAIFDLARRAGLATGFVSNGHASAEAIAYLGPRLDLCKVDLKCFDDRRYRRLGGRLQPVLDTIAQLHALGVWVEIVTLLIPGFNDSDEELDRLTAFIVSVSPAIPWHVTAYHEDYRMEGTGSTTARMLCRAAAIGQQRGLRFVYAGNMPGSVGDLECTRCPDCGALLVDRVAYRIRQVRLGADGRCPDCGSLVPGRWSTAAC